MRLFVALDIDESIRARIAGFLDGVREFAPDARWARPESLHVTLKFIGEQSGEDVVKIQQTLETIAAETIRVNFRRLGFFSGARAPRGVRIGVEGGPQLASLAASVDETLA